MAFRFWNSAKCLQFCVLSVSLIIQWKFRAFRAFELAGLDTKFQPTRVPLLLGLRKGSWQIWLPPIWQERTPAFQTLSFPSKAQLIIFCYDSSKSSNEFRLSSQRLKTRQQWRKKVERTYSGNSDNISEFLFYFTCVTARIVYTRITSYDGK